MKGDFAKVERLAEYCKDEHFNLVGVLETNIGEKDTKWMQKDIIEYESFWTDTEKDKSKGSGVGLLVDRNWAKHLGLCKKFSPYLLKAEFYFKKMIMQIWVTYVPPKNEVIAKEIHKTILETLVKNKKNTYHIILGDFNAVMEINYDTSSKEKRSIDANAKLLRWLKNTDHIETFQFCNPEIIKFSWTNGRVATRIDYIWCCQDLRPFIVRSDIDSAKTITDSDHEIVWLKLESIDLFERNRVSSRKQNRETRRLYLYHKATKEDWEAYEQKVESYFIRDRKRKESNKLKRVV